MSHRAEGIGGGGGRGDDSHDVAGSRVRRGWIILAKTVFVFWTLEDFLPSEEVDRALFKRMSEVLD